MNNHYLKYYVYTHTRLDTDSIFYIGIGTKRERGNIYERAYNKSTRNIYWRRITDKTAYRVDIVAEYSSRENAMFHEVILIKKIGRKTLANLTDGGEGTSGFTEEQRKNLSDKAKARGLNFIVKYGKDNYKSKPVIQCDLNNREMRKFENAREVERLLGYDSANIYRCCNGKRKTAYNCIWKYEDYGTIAELIYNE